MINLLRIQKTVTSNQTSSVSFVLSHLVEIDEKSVGVRHYYYIVHIIALCHYLLLRMTIFSKTGIMIKTFKAILKCAINRREDHGSHYDSTRHV